MPTTNQTRKGIGLVVAFSVSALLVAFLLTVGISGIVDDTVVEKSMNEGDSETVKGPLNVTLDNVNQSGSDITVTLGDTVDDSTTQVTNVTGFTDATIEGVTVSVRLDSIDSATSASFALFVPPDYGYSSGAQSLWGVLDLILVVGIFLLWIGWAVLQMRDV